jgi:hypothetical protein
MSSRKLPGAVVAALRQLLCGPRITILLFLFVAACDLRADRGSPAETVSSLNVATTDPGCSADSVRPSTAAPAEGLWAFSDHAASHRVAVRIGPTVGTAGATRVRRTVETLETRPGTDALRYATDTASVKLEFIPPFDRAAAVYAIGPLVQLAAYEPCRGHQEPLIRYVRKDTTGRVTTDVLLHREARP